MSKGTKIVLWLIACVAIGFVSMTLIVPLFGLKGDAVGIILFWSIISISLFSFIYTYKLNEPDSKYFGQAEKEVNGGTMDNGLWAKALVRAKGNEDKRKAEYIKLRAKQLQKES